jgi:DNA-binding transcriptional ArsR family regulator
MAGIRTPGARGNARPKARLTVCACNPEAFPAASHSSTIDSLDLRLPALLKRLSLNQDRKKRQIAEAAGGTIQAVEGFCLTISIALYKLSLMQRTLNLDATFAALADPTRRAILARLARGEATVMELAKPFEMTQPAISQHLKVLEDAGLILRRVEGTRRPRRLAKAGIKAMDEWLATLRKGLEKNYDRLDEVLASMEQNKRGEK